MKWRREGVKFQWKMKENHEWDIYSNRPHDQLKCLNLLMNGFSSLCINSWINSKTLFQPWIDSWLHSCFNSSFSKHFMNWIKNQFKYMMNQFKSRFSKNLILWEVLLKWFLSLKPSKWIHESIQISPGFLGNFWVSTWIDSVDSELIQQALNRFKN